MTVLPASHAAALAALAAIMIVRAGPAMAQEVTLRAVSAFQEGTAFSRNFERFVERVNAEGGGQIRITYIGGTRAMPPFEVGNAVRGRVVDMANVTGAFYTNLMPEADGFKLATRPMSEQRRNGAWELVNQLHNQRLNAWYLARQFQNVPFHFYFRARPQNIERLVFTGLKIRVTPVYRALVEALGGTAMQTAPGEVFTAMERGVVDGYGWPILGVFDLGWEQVTRFRVDPGFYNVDVNVLVNLESWRRLSDRQRQILEAAALWRGPRRRERRDHRGRAPAPGAGEHPGDCAARSRRAALRRARRRGRLAVGHPPEPGNRPPPAPADRELGRRVAVALLPRILRHAPPNLRAWAGLLRMRRFFAIAPHRTPHPE